MGIATSHARETNQHIPSGSLGPRPPQTTSTRREQIFTNSLPDSEFSWTIGDRFFQGFTQYGLNPADFPPPSVVHERTVRNTVRVSKSSLRLVSSTGRKNLFVLQFCFDSLVDCTITCYYFAEEVVDRNYVSFRSTYSKEPSESFCPAGLGQTYRQPESEGIDFTRVQVKDLSDVHSDRYPIVISIKTQHDNVAVSESNIHATENATDSQFRTGNNNNSGNDTVFNDVDAYFIYLSLCSEEKADESLQLKILKQKILVNGVIYELEEIYGIDAGSAAVTPEQQSDNSRADESASCAICLSQPRDTTLLPCRHMCLCSECAQRLRFQSNCCPICRQSVQSFLQIKGLPQSGCH
eukprot:jgi/Galph1/4432/GphlegSOOS_G3045.1